MFVQRQWRYRSYGDDREGAIVHRHSVPGLIWHIRGSDGGLHLVAGVHRGRPRPTDPRRQSHGTHFGKDEGVKNLPYAFWPDLSSLADPDLEAIGFRFKACTNDCNKATMDNAEGNHIILPRTIGTVAVPIGYESVVSLDRYCRPDTEVLKDYVDSAQ